MKDSCCVAACSSDMRGQRGSVNTFSLVGWAIVAVVVLFGFGLYFGADFGKPMDPTILEAEKAMADKNWEGAMALYEKALKADPNNSDALVGRSRVYVQLGELDKALTEANAAIAKKPSNAMAYGERGLIHKLQQKPEEAMKDFDKAVQLDSRHYYWAYAQRGDLFLKKKELTKALKNLNEALKLKPNFPEALRLRAWVYNRQGKCKEAFEDFKKVEKLVPNDPWSMQDKAWFLMTCPDEKVQDTAKAMELAQKVAEGPEGKDGLVLEVLAEGYFKQGDYAKAAELQKQAIEMGSAKCPDHSCTKEMEERLQKYELVGRQEVRSAYEILPMENAPKK